MICKKLIFIYIYLQKNTNMIMWNMSPYFLNQKMTTHELNLWNTSLYDFLNDFKIMGINAVFITGFLNGVLIRANNHDDVMMIVGYLNIVHNKLTKLKVDELDQDKDQEHNKCCCPYDTMPICRSNNSIRVHKCPRCGVNESVMFGCKPEGAGGFICDTCDMVLDKESIFAGDSVMWINSKELIEKTRLLVNYEEENGIPIWTSDLSDSVLKEDWKDAWKGTLNGWYKIEATHKITIINPLLDFIGDSITLPNVENLIHNFCRMMIPYKDTQECYYKVMLLYNKKKKDIYTDMIKRWKVGTQLLKGFDIWSSCDIMDKVGLYKVLSKYKEVELNWVTIFRPEFEQAYLTFVEMCKADIKSVNNLNYVIYCLDQIIAFIDDGVDIGLLAGQTLLCLLKRYGNGIITKPVSKKVLVHFRRYINYIRLATIGNLVNYYKETKHNLKKAEKAAHRLFEVLVDSNIDECLLMLFGKLTKEDFDTFKTRLNDIIYLSFSKPFVYGMIENDMDLPIDIRFEYFGNYKNNIDNIFVITRSIVIKEDDNFTISLAKDIVNNETFISDLIE